MTEIQRAVVRKQVVRIDYSNTEEQETQREVEPIGIFTTAWRGISSDGVVCEMGIAIFVRIELETL